MMQSHAEAWGVSLGPPRSRHQDGIKGFYFIRGNAGEKENRERADRLGELLFYTQVCP